MALWHGDIWHYGMMREEKMEEKEGEGENERWILLLSFLTLSSFPPLKQQQHHT